MLQSSARSISHCRRAGSFTGSYHSPIFLTTWHLTFATIGVRILKRSTRLLDGLNNVQMTWDRYLRSIVPIGALFSASLIFSKCVLSSVPLTHAAWPTSRSRSPSSRCSRRQCRSSSSACQSSSDCRRRINGRSSSCSSSAWASLWPRTARSTSPCRASSAKRSASSSKPQDWSASRSCYTA